MILFNSANQLAALSNALFMNFKGQMPVLPLSGVPACLIRAVMHARMLENYFIHVCMQYNWVSSIINLHFKCQIPVPVCQVNQLPEMSCQFVSNALELVEYKHYFW